MELSERLDEVVITTAHAADMCIEESDASAPFEASALAILWHSPFKVGRIGPTVVINCLVKGLETLQLSGDVANPCNPNH